VLSYAPGAPERKRLEAELARQAANPVEIPCVVGGERVHTGRVENVVAPHAHHRVLAKLHKADPETVERAIRASLDARREWSQMLSAWTTFQILEEAGLPPGVINFLPGSGSEISPMLVDHPDFAALHFTGSTEVFRSLWKRAAANLERYKSFPRLVGETGGKD